MDALHEAVGNALEGDEAFKIVRADGDVGDLARDGRAVGHCNACVGLAERRRIVHTIADHDDLAALFVLGADERGLVLGQHLGVVFVNAGIFCNGSRGALAVAGHHDELVKTQRAQGIHNAAHLAAQRIGDADDRRERAAYGKVKVRILRGERGKFIPLIIRYGAALVLENEVVAAEDDLLTVNGAVDAVGNDVFDLGVALVVVQAAADRFVYDGVCYRVRIVLLKAGGEAEHLVLLVSAEGYDIGDLGACVGERAGFVENDGVGLGDGLKELAALDGDAVCAALAHGRKHRYRHGKLQRAGEIDHEYGKRLGRVARYQPCQRRCAEAVRHEPVGKVIRLRLGVALELFRVLDHVDDPVVAAAAEAFFDLYDALALFDDRSAVDIAADLLANGHALAGHGRLVYRRRAGNELAVKRYHAAHAHDDIVADVDVGDVFKLLGIAGLDPHLVNIQAHGARKIVNGLLVRPLLEDIADLEHEHYRRRGVGIAAQDGNGYGRCVEDGNVEPLMPQRLYAARKILRAFRNADSRAPRRRKQRLFKHPAHHDAGELILIFAV